MDEEEVEGAQPDQGSATAGEKAAATAQNVKQAAQATKSIAAGAASGGLAGAGLAAGKEALKTKTGRRIAVIILAVLVAMTMPMMLTMMGAVTTVIGGAQESDADYESTEIVSETSDISDDELSIIKTLSDTYGVPWQMVAALTVAGSSQMAVSTVSDVSSCDALSGSAAAVEDGLTEYARAALRCVNAYVNDSDLSTYGYRGVGDRPSTVDDDHQAGRAVDIMITNDSSNITDGQTEAGWQLAKWLAKNADSLHVKYLIFDAQLWTASNPTWRDYSHPGGYTDPTSMHLDRVHISVYKDGEGVSSSSATTTSDSWGAYNLEADGSNGYTQDEAEDFTKATRFVARKLSALLDQSRGTGTTALSAGVLTSGGERYWAAEDTGDKPVTQQSYDAAVAVQDVYVASISQMPVSNMDESLAEQVFQVGLNWYLGREASMSGSYAICTAATGSVTSLTSQQTTGAAVSLNEIQLTNAAEVIAAGIELGISENGLTVGLMVALQESSLLNYANDGSYTPSGRWPRAGYTTESEWLAARAVAMQSLDMKHDAVGSDWDSVGLFQQRPSMGWGTVEELMTPKTSATKFFERLMTIDGWESMQPTVAAQTVQGSAYPSAYAKWSTVADDILAAIGTNCATDGEFSADGWTQPNPNATYISSPFGIRVHPITGVTSFHGGTDLPAPAGSPIVAAQDGTVTKVGGCYTGCVDNEYGISGFFIVVTHDGGYITTYNHMNKMSPLAVGTKVKAGDVIGEVGNSGYSTGAHLHFQVLRTSGSGREYLDPDEFYRDELGISLIP